MEPMGPGPVGPPTRRRARSRPRAVVLLVALGLVAAMVVLAVRLWHDLESASGVAFGPVVTGQPAAMSGAPPHAPNAADATTAASRVSPGLVDISTTLGYANAQAAGTGIVLTPDGEVLTNNHVIAGATDITATDVGTGRNYPAEVVGYDRSHDIAVIQLKGASGLATSTLGDSSGARVGMPVVAVGNAGGVGGAPSSAAGTIAALDRSVTASDEMDGSSEQLTGLIQVNAPLQSGDSGGPLVNQAGEIIGVDTAASTGFQVSQSGGGEGYAIPINQARAIARQIETGAASQTVHIGPTPILGVQVQDVSALEGRRHRHAASFVTPGALVSGVLTDSPADQAGVSGGDVITSFDGQTVDSTTTLSRLLDAHHPGDTVDLGWVDGFGQQHSAPVQLVTGPAA